MEVDKSIFVLSAMLIHRRFSLADISKLTFLPRTTVWRALNAIPSLYPGTVIKSFDLPEYQLEEISPLFNEDGLRQYYELCLAQLANDNSDEDAVLPLSEMNLTSTNPEQITANTEATEQPQHTRVITPPPGRRF